MIQEYATAAARVLSCQMTLNSREYAPFAQMVQCRQERMDIMTAEMAAKDASQEVARIIMQHAAQLNVQTDASLTA